MRCVRWNPGDLRFASRPAFPYNFLRLSTVGHSSFTCIARIAQLVEHLICNQAVGGSNPSAGSISFRITGSTCLRPIIRARVYSAMS